MGCSAFSAFLAVACFGSILAVDWDVTTDLDLYVHSDDGHFTYAERVLYSYPGVTLYMYNMTSQKYQSDDFSTRSVWWHWLLVAIPIQIVNPDAAWMLIGDSSNSNAQPPALNDQVSVLLTSLARDTNTISACIQQVPNQPIRFHDDSSSALRSEDDIIAWTWRHFIDSPEPSDPTVLLRMPMTKAVKRGLDAVTEIAKDKRPETDVKKFIVYGTGKRGWTAWSLAAVDPRVVAIAPMVFSLLNMEETIANHFRSMDGGWSFALNPFYKENLTQEIFKEKTSRIYAVEDMYSYRERLTIPILEVLVSGDEFFLVDDSHSWWNDIPSEQKYLMMLPNAEHSMAPHFLQIYEGLVSFGLSVLQNVPLPKVTWEMDQTDTGGYIRLVADPPPVVVRAYSAVTLSSDTRRDFRLSEVDSSDNIYLHPVVWRRNLEVEQLGEGQYLVQAENVVDEWVGFFMEAEWEGPGGRRMTFTSQVNIIPNTYPHEACSDPQSCWGKLV